MKNIKTFKQHNETLLNESLSFDTLKNILNKLSKSVDTKKVANLVIPNKKLLTPYLNKYVKDGVIMADLIYEDFSKLNFRANEAWGDYADDSSNHPVLRFLYKLFYRWPKNFIMGVWEVFYDMVIDTWGESKIMSIFAGMLWLLVGILVYLLGYLTYSVVEHEISGLDKGIVKEEKFDPGHYEVRVHVISNGKTTSTYTTNDWVPDTWYIEVEGDGRKEVWYTYNSEVGKSVDVGDEVVNNDDWTWGETK
jgi:hypothetical protein